MWHAELKKCLRHALNALGLSPSMDDGSRALIRQMLQDVSNPFVEAFVLLDELLGFTEKCCLEKMFAITMAGSNVRWCQMDLADLLVG